MSLESIVGEQA